MKQNRFIYILLIIFSIFLVIGCQKIKETTDSAYFIEQVYNWSNGKLENSILIDLRKLDEEYAMGHISGAKSYDYSKVDKEKFTTWITGMYHKKTTVLLIDSGNNEYQLIVEYLKEAGYKKIIAYTKGYNTLKEDESFKIKLIEVKGKDDCGC